MLKMKIGKSLRQVNVQVIKDTKDAKGNLQFGTEVITSEDGTLAALLGASPGASTAVDIMFDVLQRCYKDDFKIMGASN